MYKNVQIEKKKAAKFLQKAQSEQNVQFVQAKKS